MAKFLISKDFKFEKKQPEPNYEFLKLEEEMMNDINYLENEMNNNDKVYIFFLIIWVILLIVLLINN